MKRLLPILTLALLGAAATASAENFYYDYYQGPGKSGVTNEYWVVDPYNKYESGTDTFTYKNFAVSRNSDWEYLGNANTTVKNKAIIDGDNFYRISVIGDNVNLYLTDFVDNVGGATNANALYNRISEYGYRKLQAVVDDDGNTHYVASTNQEDSKKYSLTGDNAVTPTVKDSIYFEKTYLDENNEIVDDSYTVTRYQYSLGTFNDGDVIELYMKDLNGGEAYSYSGINEIDPTTSAPVGAEGGFGDGGYRVNLQTDAMLNGYYYLDENLQPEYRGFGDNEDARALASSKSMPLSALDPSGSRVYFGIIASTGVIGGGNGGGGNGGDGDEGGGQGGGQPLPGGLPIALIAGLFGLGFWYVRRRKVIAG